MSAASDLGQAPELGAGLLDAGESSSSSVESAGNSSAGPSTNNMGPGLLPGNANNNPGLRPTMMGTDFENTYTLVVWVT